MRTDFLCVPVSTSVHHDQNKSIGTDVLPLRIDVHCVPVSTSVHHDLNKSISTDVLLVRIKNIIDFYIRKLLDDTTLIENIGMVYMTLLLLYIRRIRN